MVYLNLPYHCAQSLNISYIWLCTDKLKTLTCKLLIWRAKGDFQIQEMSAIYDQTRKKRCVPSTCAERSLIKCMKNWKVIHSGLTRIVSLWTRPAPARGSVSKRLPGEGAAFSSAQGVERIKTKQLLSVSALKKAQADEDLHTQLREEIMEVLVICRWGYYMKWKVHKHNAYFVKS